MYLDALDKIDFEEARKYRSLYRFQLDGTAPREFYNALEDKILKRLLAAATEAVHADGCR